MNKRIAIVAVLGLVAAGAVTINSQVFASAAIVEDLGICGDDETNSVFVITNNKSGNMMFSCQGSTAVGPPEVTILKNSGICDGLGLGPAFRDHIIWNPKGNFSVTCNWK